MKRYSVLIKKVVMMECRIEVDALSEEDARVIGFNRIYDDKYVDTWEWVEDDDVDLPEVIDCTEVEPELMSK